MRIPAKVAGLGYDKLAMMAAGKVFGERLAAPYIGNGTLRSGAIKLAVALGVPMVVHNDALKTILAGVAIDGVEDVILEITAGGASRSFVQTDAVMRV